MRKKLLSLALALVMCLGLAVPALAYSIEGGNAIWGVTNESTGTEEISYYTVNVFPVGTVITVEKPGFHTATVGGTVVHSSVYIRTYNLDGTVAEEEKEIPLSSFSFTLSNNNYFYTLRTDTRNMSGVPTWGDEIWCVKASGAVPAPAPETCKDNFIYEVRNSKCAYELSNDPVGTIEYTFKERDWANAAYVYATRTVYIVPDNTKVRSKTVPDGILTDEICVYGDDNLVSHTGVPVAGEPFTVYPYGYGWEDPLIWRVYTKDSDSGYLDYTDGGISLMAKSSAAAAGLSAAAPNNPAPEAAPGFTDVAADAYYAAPVMWALEQGITTGTSTTTFSPGQNCTNAQILTFLWRAYGQPESTIGNPFTNSVPDAYTKAAVWAYEKGMVSGTAFDADKPCTRAMAVTYMWQAAGSPMPFASADSFTDVPADASYALAVAWALEKGITTGTSATTFSPDEICNRGQIVTFLYRNLA